MSAPAERMKLTRQRRRDRGLRELRLLVPDPRLEIVRNRVAMQVANLDRTDEDQGLAWIEGISEFDTVDTEDGREERE